MQRTKKLQYEYLLVLVAVLFNFILAFINGSILPVTAREGHSSRDSYSSSGAPRGACKIRQQNGPVAKLCLYLPNYSDSPVDSAN